MPAMMPGEAMAQASACSDSPAIMHGADRRQHDAGGDEDARVDIAHQIVAGDGERDGACHRARDEQHAGVHGRIAHEPLGEQRQKRDGAEQRHAIGGDGEQAGKEVAVLEQRQVDDVLRVVPAAHEEGDAGEDGDGGEDLDEARVEPVARLALVEHQLQRANRQHEENEPGPIGLEIFDRRSCGKWPMASRRAKMPIGTLM